MGHVVIIGAGLAPADIVWPIRQLVRRQRNTRVLMLPSFPEELSHYTEAALKRPGGEVRLGKAVTRCGAYGITLGDEVIEAGTSSGLPASTLRWRQGGCGARRAPDHG